MTVEIKNKLYKDISNYCKANHLVIKEYVNQLLTKQFMVDKYGDKPGIYIVPDKPVEVTSAEENSEFPPVFTKENGHLGFDKPVEVEIEVKKNDKTKEYEIEMKETTIPIETNIEKDILKNAEELSKLKETIKSALAANQKPAEEITIDTVKKAIESVQEYEPVKEKPKIRKLK